MKFTVEDNINYFGTQNVTNNLHVKAVLGMYHTDHSAHSVNSYRHKTTFSQVYMSQKHWHFKSEQLIQWCNNLPFELHADTVLVYPLCWCSCQTSHKANILKRIEQKTLEMVPLEGWMLQ